MFERFTDGARRAVMVAQEQGRLLNHNFLGTEHLLIGLTLDDGIAGYWLRERGVTTDAVVDEVERVVGRGGSTPIGHVPWTPPAKKVFELSLREALGIGHAYIGTEHILLGILREGEGVGCAVLRSFPVEWDEAYAEFRRSLFDELQTSVDSKMDTMSKRWPSREREFYAAVAAEALTNTDLRVEERAVLMVACDADPGSVEWSSVQLDRAALFASTLPPFTRSRVSSFFFERLVDHARKVAGSSFCEDSA